jgi:hypothetical protein
MTQRFAEKRVDVAAGCEAVDWLPRSLRSVAGAPRTARKKKPATPVGMTERKNREEGDLTQRAPRKSTLRLRSGQAENAEKTEERNGERRDAEGAEKRCREWDGI